MPIVAPYMVWYFTDLSRMPTEFLRVSVETADLIPAASGQHDCMNVCTVTRFAIWADTPRPDKGCGRMVDSHIVSNLVVGRYLHDVLTNCPGVIAFSTRSTNNFTAHIRCNYLSTVRLCSQTAVKVAVAMTSLFTSSCQLTPLQVWLQQCTYLVE
jgi:hypothetical protein